MAAVTSASAARKKARDHAAALLDADDLERRRLEQARRKRITDAAADIAGNDLEIEQLMAKIELLRAASTGRLADIVAENVSEEQAAAMTGRALREVKAAVKAGTSASRAPSKKPAAKRAVAEPKAA